MLQKREQKTLVGHEQWEINLVRPQGRAEKDCGRSMRRMYYSAMLTPEPPISFGMSLIFGNPSFIRSFVSS